jgi:uncharacterized protein with PQ loop repeat
MLPIIVATLAPTINCIEFFPQLHKTYTTKSVKDLSFYSVLLFSFGSLLWLLHGYFIEDFSLTISGSISLFINLTLLIMYMLYHKKGH